MVKDGLDEVAFLQQEIVIPIPIVMEGNAQFGLHETTIVGHVLVKGLVAVVGINQLGGRLPLLHGFKHRFVIGFTTVFQLACHVIKQV